MKFFFNFKRMIEEGQSIQKQECKVAVFSHDELKIHTKKNVGGSMGKTISIVFNKYFAQQSKDY
jgi:hypothetical protein